MKYLIMTLFVLNGCGQMTSDKLMEQAGKACEVDRDGQKLVDVRCGIKYVQEKCKKDKLDLFVCCVISSYGVQ